MMSLGYCSITMHKNLRSCQISWVVCHGTFELSGEGFRFSIDAFEVDDSSDPAFVLLINGDEGKVAYDSLEEAMAQLAKIIQTGKRGGVALKMR